MTLDCADTLSAANGERSNRSPRNQHLLVRRCRDETNDSENSVGSGKSPDSPRSLTPAIKVIPGSAPASRSGSFRDRPESTDTSFRYSPTRRGLTSSREGSNTSSVVMSSCDGSSQDTTELSDDNSFMRARRNSMPSVAESFLPVPSSDDVKESRLKRIRSFKTTSKGLVVNRGDSFKKSSKHGLMSAGNAITDARPKQTHHHNQSKSINDNNYYQEPQTTSTYYRVIMIGAAGCGKTLMTQQFMTSDYVGGDEDNPDAHEHTVTVLLDGEESTIQFIDPPNRNVIFEGLQQLLDAYVVVFAINDSSSFERAQDLVRYLRVDYGTDRVIVLVANKIDLVRKRKVSADEARLVAETYDCKYTEISAALNHYVDELLVGILTQIRLHLRIPFTTISFPGKELKTDDRKEKRRSLKGPRGFFSRLFRRSSRRKMKPCENLYTL